MLLFNFQSSFFSSTYISWKLREHVLLCRTCLLRVICSKCCLSKLQLRSFVPVRIWNWLPVNSVAYENVLFLKYMEVIACIRNCLYQQCTHIYKNIIEKLCIVSINVNKHIKFPLFHNLNMSPREKLLLENFYLCVVIFHCFRFYLFNLKKYSEYLELVICPKSNNI